MFPTVARALQFALLASILVQPAVARGEDEDGVAPATLDGRSVALAIASEHHCHDALGDALTCFSNAEDRDASYEADSQSHTELITSSSGYVIAYVHASFAGSSVVLSQDYSNLGTIGWGDKISSYKVYTSATGYFHEHTWYAGRTQAYCCLTHVTYVGDTLNDTFSSFTLP